MFGSLCVVACEDEMGLRSHIAFMKLFQSSSTYFGDKYILLIPCKCVRITQQLKMDIWLSQLYYSGG
jgi:hypothetical protein